MSKISLSEINQIAPSAEPTLIPSKAPRNIIPTPNRHERRLQFGIDCAESLHFHHWEPGGEHVKHLIVKNVVMKTQKIRYKLPQTRYFSMEFPETVTLSAGMCLTVPIKFRPVAKECYNDVIEFTTSFGKFFLPIKATLPEHVLEFPSNFDFGFCPNMETVTKTFLLKNTGELESYYNWNIPEPFSLSPNEGNLQPGEFQTVKIEFSPKKACPYQAVAVCAFGDQSRWEKSKVLHKFNVCGTGKYSHICLSGDQSGIYNFGEVYIGRTCEKKTILENPSVVPANFIIKRAEKEGDPYFEFSQTAGVIPPKGKIEITITYTPVAAGLNSTDYFNITTVSGNTISIECIGRGIGSKVVLSNKIVNFNDAPINTVVVRSITIQNLANNPAFYQFNTERNSTFEIDKPWGTIHALSSLSLTLKFCATDAINYYRRTYCMVEHQDSLYIDFLGTGYSDKRRPATFVHRHITSYQERIKNGLWGYGPEQLEDMLKNGVIKYTDGYLSFVDNSKNFINEDRLILDFPYETGKIASEYFYENTGDTLACTLLDTYVDFGSCSRYRIVEPQTIRISNNTTGKMSCVWIIPGETKGEILSFSITPQMTDIPPKSIAEFKVHFRPERDNSFYGVQLECFVYFKSMRNFRLVNEETFTPPWCLTPMVAGNTFPPGEDTFIPKVNFGNTRLDFPGCFVGKSVYRTVRISNTGDTPVKFSFVDSKHQQSDRYDSRDVPVFSVKPKIGMLHSNESRLIVFRFFPTEDKIYEMSLKCFFNSSWSNSYDLNVKGHGFFPQISLGNQNTLIFRPTCINAVSKRIFKARNMSRIAVYYEWKIPRQYESLVKIEPTSGVFGPNSSMEMACIFTPSDTNKWVMKIPCYFSHDSGQENFLPNRETLTILGRGAVGTIVASPQKIDFGVILVNTISEKDVTVQNSSDCDIYYSLEIYAKRSKINSVRDDTDYFEIDIDESQKSELKIQQHASVLSARSSHTLKLKACVKDQNEYEFIVYYRIESQDAIFNKSNPVSERLFLCEVKAVGVHPILQVVDIQCDGMCKPLLWQMFSINALNDDLKQISIDPMAYADFSLEIPSIGSKQDGLDENADASPRPMIFNFGITPVGHKPTVINIALQNNGVVPVDWIFNFPNDLDVELEGWADPGEYTEDQIHQNLILDNSLFNVTPKSGSLMPNEITHVLLSYSHEFAGFHKLPVLFKLKNGASRCGKEVMLYFSGLSVIPKKNFLQTPAYHQEFDSIEIGSEYPPVQTFRLINNGIYPLEYSVDTTPLIEMKKELGGVDVFIGKKLSGIIAPKSVDFLEWIFRPISTKSYELEVPILVKDGKSCAITLIGSGYMQKIRHNDKCFIKHDPSIFPDSIPTKQILKSSHQAATLSVDRFNFGHIPLGSIMRQIVVLQNTKDDVDVMFQWRIPSFWGHNAVRVSPSSGLLKSKSSKICKITFYPRDSSKIYDHEIYCEITNKSDLDKFQAKQDIINKSRREREMLDNDSLSKDKDNSNSGTQSSLRDSKFKPLPPINGVPRSAEDQKRRSDNDQSNMEEDRENDATPPQSTDLIVTIKARTYDIQEFRNLFTGYDSFYFDKKINYSVQTNANKLVSKDIKENVETTMMSILDDLMMDQDVKDCVDFKRQTFPYYAQICPDARNGIFLKDKNTDELDEKKNQNVLSDSDILSSLEFQNFTESILEATIYNLMQEVNAQEFNFTKYPMLFINNPALSNIVKTWEEGNKVAK